MIIKIYDESEHEVRKGMGVKCFVGGSKFTIDASVVSVSEKTLDVKAAGKVHTIIHAGVLEVIDPSTFVLNEATAKRDLG